MKLKNITIVFIFLALNSINGMTTSHGNNPQKNKYFSCLTDFCGGFQKKLFPFTKGKFTCPSTLNQKSLSECRLLENALSHCMSVCMKNFN